MPWPCCARESVCACAALLEVVDVVATSAFPSIWGWEALAPGSPKPPTPAAKLPIAPGSLIIHSYASATLSAQRHHPLPPSPSPPAVTYHPIHSLAYTFLPLHPPPRALRAPLQSALPRSPRPASPARPTALPRQRPLQHGALITSLAHQPTCLRRCLTSVIGRPLVQTADDAAEIICTKSSVPARTLASACTGVDKR